MTKYPPQGSGGTGSHTHIISDVTGLQSALDGKASTIHTHSQSDITNLVTDLANKQPLDSDLTAIAGLTPTNDDIIQRKSGNWVNRTISQLKTDLSLTKSDVGLSNVDNTSDVNKPISIAVQAALDGKQNNLGFTPENSANKGIASGYASLDGSVKIPISQIPTGTTSTTVCVGNDSRLSDKRAPTITNETTNDIMYYNGTNWVRLATASGFLKGGATPAYSAIAESDVTGLVSDLASKYSITNRQTNIITSEISIDQVDNTILSNMAQNTIKGRITAGTGNPEDLTPANVRTMINVADGANNYTHPNHSGDVISVGDGLQTIQNNSVTYAKMQDVSSTSRFIGRITTGAGDPEELTGTQATTLLDVFTTTLKGLTPASGGGTSNFLRADGTWASPGASSTDIKQTEVDFGITPLPEASFVITDAAISTSNQIIAQVSYDTPTGKDQDEIEMDRYDLNCTAGTGQFTLYMKSVDGSYLHDKFKINYLIG